MSSDSFSIPKPVYPLRDAWLLRLAGYALVLLIIYGSLVHFDFTANPRLRLYKLVSWPRWNPEDIIENIAALIPVGLLFGAQDKRDWRLTDYGLTALICILLQVAQLWLPERDPRFSDAFWNIIGLVGGLVFARALHGLRRWPGAPEPLTTALAIAFLGHITLVALVARGWSMAGDQFQLQRDWVQDGVWLSLARFAVGGFAVAGLLGLGRTATALATPASRIAILVLLLCAVLLRLDRWHEHYLAALAMIVGAIACVCLPRSRVPLAVAGVVVLVTLWDGMTPWQLIHQPMQWQPFHSLIEAPSVPLIATMAWKLFAWSTLAWAATETDASRWFTILLPTGLAATLELLQTVVASGSPDVSDPLLAGLMAGIVILVHDPAHPQNRRTTP